MNEKLKGFLELMEQNSELKSRYEELSKTENARIAHIIALAGEYGIELTYADLQPRQSDGKLSDDELEAVNGGGICINPGMLCFPPIAPIGNFFIYP